MNHKHPDLPASRAPRRGAENPSAQTLAAADIPKTLLDQFIADHHLPDAFRDTASARYLPLASQLAAEHRGECRVIGINGAQGSGKSTLADLLERVLTEHYGLRVATLSIDDIYLTRAQREALAERVHPLLLTRSVPGTHDVALGLDTLQRLRALRAGESMALPRFDKATDDRLPPSRWPVVEGPVDMVLFEGWCIATPAQAERELEPPLNALEANEDRDGRWRRYVNEQLRERYPALFAEIDRLILMKAPDFDCVYRWRLKQERKLAARVGEDGNRVMDAEQIKRFVQHFERLTRVNLQHLPGRADVVFALDEDQQIVDEVYR